MDPAAGLIVLAAGPRTVYYSRTIAPDMPDTFHDTPLVGPNDSDRLTYLQAMLGPSDQATLQADTHASVRWSTPQALVRQVETARGDVERQYRALVDALVLGGCLEKAEAVGLPSPIHVELVDQRQDQSVPLPIIRH